MIVVSYGTKDGRYDRHLGELKEMLKEAGLKHDLKVVPPTFEARKCLIKPRIIIDALAKHKCPVVWLDADTTVLKPFALPDGDWDVGTVPNTNPHSISKNPTCAFVLAFRPTQKALHFLKVWKYLCDWHELCPNRQDHKRLTWTREMQRDFYTEIDLSEALHGTMIRDVGTVKEAAL